jgi:hypothetical protein
MTERKDPCRTCTPAKMADEGCCANNLGYGVKIVTNGFRRISVCKMLTKMEDRSWGCGVTEDGARPPECASYSCYRKINSGW